MEVRFCAVCGRSIATGNFCSTACFSAHERMKFPGPIPPEKPHLRLSDKIVVSKVGATQSHVAERYDLLCPAAIRRLARRYALGAEKHSEFNYCLAGDDQKFQRARINHTIKHLMLYLERGNFDEDGKPDDNLGAAMWGMATTIHFEEGCKHHLAPIPGNAMTDERFVSARKKEEETKK